MNVKAAQALEDCFCDLEKHFLQAKSNVPYTVLQQSLANVVRLIVDCTDPEAMSDGTEDPPASPFSWGTGLWAN